MPLPPTSTSCSPGRKPRRGPAAPPGDGLCVSWPAGALRKPQHPPEHHPHPHPQPQPHKDRSPWACAQATPQQATAQVPESPQQPEEELRFTLSLTPEAILVLQKRNLEKQMLLAKQKEKKGCASAEARHRRAGGHRRAAKADKAPVDRTGDIRAIVKISLLNERHKYDDVEYEEEEEGDVDETVVRKCKEWLRGVESATELGKN